MPVWEWGSEGRGGRVSRMPPLPHSPRLTVWLWESARPRLKPQAGHWLLCHIGQDPQHPLPSDPSPKRGCDSPSLRGSARRADEQTPHMDGPRERCVTCYLLVSGDHLPLAAESPAHGRALASFTRTGLSRILESEGRSGWAGTHRHLEVPGV